MKISNKIQGVSKKAYNFFAILTVNLKSHHFCLINVLLVKVA